MAETEINVVGLSSSKKGGKSNWKIIGAIIGIVVLALGIIAGILLVKQQQDIREKADVVSCTDSVVEQCPVAGSPNILRNCHPPEADNSPVESLCDTEGKISFCGTKNYCCPSAGGSWTTDMSACVEEVSVITDLTSDQEITCSQGFTDSFDSIDTNRWQKCGDGVSVSSGVLIIKRDEAGTSSTCETSDILSTKESLSGDFVVEMDIPEVYKSGDGAGAATIVFSADNTGTTGLNIVRGRKNKNQNKTFYISTTLSSGGNSDTSGQVNLASGPVSVKVERKTGVFSVYYKAGNGSYTLLKRFQNTLTTPIKNIHLSVMNTEFSPAEYTTVKYDNFKISCSGTNPTTIPTATPTGAGPTVTPTTTPTGAGPTVTPTATPTRTATPTATSTGIRTSTPTATATSGIGGGGATATATSRATATTSSVPIPVTGVNLPTLLGTGFGIIMILVSLALAL
jgi:hypothetical protein